MARIIDLKNRRLQAQEPAPQSKLIQPQVETAAFRPRGFTRPGLEQGRPDSQDESRILDFAKQNRDKENSPPSQVTPEPKTQAFNWSGPLYIHRPDKKIIAAVSLALFIIAVLMQIFQKNVITTIFFGMLGVVILIRASKKPEIVDFEIGPLGVKVDERLYGFREIKSFWIEYDPALDIKELSLQLKKWYRAYIKIPIYDQNPVQLRLILLAFLPEVEHQDTLADTVSRKLGI